MIRFLPPLLALPALAGCGAVYENRIESALVGAGVRERWRNAWPSGWSTSSPNRRSTTSPG